MILTRELRAALAAAITLTLSACLVGDPFGSDHDREPRNTVLPTTLPLGVVTGAIYDTGSSDFAAGEPVFSTHADEIACDIANLGARWIRIEAGWDNTGDAVWADIVRAAHAKGLRVIAVLSGYHCPDSASSAIDMFYRSPQDYVTRLRALTGPGGPFYQEPPDAWEIINEPNIEDSMCALPQPFRVPANAYVDIVRAAWEWKKAEGRSELLIAGAPLGTALKEPWWQGMFESMLVDAAGGDRPFDRFGVHPYNSHWLDTENPATIPQWQCDTRDSLTELDRKLDCIYTTGGSRGCLDIGGENNACVPSEVPASPGPGALIATEFGYQVCPGPGADNAAKCVDGDAGAADMLEASVRAMANSGAVTDALFYNYRDDAAAGGARHGLRRRWNGDSNRLRLDLADRFRRLAGSGGDRGCFSRSADMGVGRSPEGAIDIAIVSCHQRHRGAAAAGSPTDNGGSAYVHDWAPGDPVQDFAGGTLGPNICMRRSGWSTAYMVRGGIRDKYLEIGGGPGPLGYPIADEADDGAGPYQLFERGRIRAGDGVWIVEPD
jgi:hypothetical protein